MGTSHRELIDLWPSIRAFGEDIGVDYNTAKHIRRRGTVPSSYWVRMVAGAAAHGYRGVTFEALAQAVAPARTVVAGTLAKVG